MVAQTDRSWRTVDSSIRHPGFRVESRLWIDARNEESIDREPARITGRSEFESRCRMGPWIVPVERGRAMLRTKSFWHRRPSVRSDETARVRSRAVLCAGPVRSGNRLAKSRWSISVLILSILCAATWAARAEDEPFRFRGYYFILSRNPGYGLSDYVRILDCMKEDRANVLILWIGGGFPSKRYPETWDYNREHANCRENFAGRIIDAARARGIRVLLGLTPFAYDGVNRYGQAHPELGAVDTQGAPAVTGGIHSLGRGLCPSKAASREFMAAYARELFEDFYPNADGFFIEHSDYGICQCADCRDDGALRREWDFVSDLSKSVWAKNPDAWMFVYPQYSRIGAVYDPRHVIFVAPHNMAGAESIENPKVLWMGYWDTGAFWKGLATEAAKNGYAGILPSMENFDYEHRWAFDTRWGPEGSVGWEDILVRVTRLSFREYARVPALEDASFRASVAQEFFGAASELESAADLLDLHTVLNRWRGWTYRGGVVDAPKEPIDLTRLDEAARTRLTESTLPDLARVRGVAERSLRRFSDSRHPDARATLRSMASIALWTLDRWDEKLPADLARVGLPRDPSRGLAFASVERPRSFPHRIWAASDFEARLPDYAWFGAPDVADIPVYPGNKTALRGEKAQDFAAVLVGMNPVPGPRMGAHNKVYFRYLLDGTSTAQVQHFNLSREDNHHIVVGGLSPGAWSELTLDFSADSLRNDGSPGAMSVGDRMDDLKIFVGRHGDAAEYRILIDDVIFFDDDPALPPEPEPFPRRIIYLAGFDTGEKEKYWRGDGELVADGLPPGSAWRAMRAVPRKDGRGKLVSLLLDPWRRVGAHTKLRFKFHLRGTTSIIAQIFDATVQDNRHVRLDDLPQDVWTTRYVDFTRDGRRNDGTADVLPAGNELDDIFFFTEGDEKIELLIDEVVLFDAGEREN
jgi:hypothetical protein